MHFKRIFLSIIFVLFASTALAAKPEKILVCHVGNELGSSGETYQDNSDCTIPPEWGGDPADYVCPDAGKVDLIMVSENARHIGNPSHSFLDDTGYLWEDYSPEAGIGDDPADFEEGEVPGIDRGCELDTGSECPCNASTAQGAAYPLWTADFPAVYGGDGAGHVSVTDGDETKLVRNTVGGAPQCYIEDGPTGAVLLRVTNLTAEASGACDAELRAIIAAIPE